MWRHVNCARVSIAMRKFPAYEGPSYSYAQVALLTSFTSDTAGVASLASHCRGCELV